MDPVGKAGKTDAQAGATMMVVAATSNIVIRSRYTPGSSTSRAHGGDSRHNSCMAAAAAAAAATISTVTTAGTAASANQPLGQLGDTTSPSAVHPLGQLGETTSPKAVPERSASPAETTPSRRRSVALAAGHVTAVRRGGPLPRRVQSNYARTSAGASAIRGIIFRSSCRTVRYLPSCPVDATRQRWTFDHVNLQASAATRQLYTCPPMPPPPRSDRLTPPPPAFPSESDWSFYSGQSQALRAHYVPTGEFPSSVSSDWRTGGGSVGGSYLPSAFVWQSVGIDQVGDVWIGDSGATSHMTRNADLTYDTSPPSPHRSRIILSDGSIRRVQFVGKLDLVFNSRTGHPVTLHDVSFVPDLGSNLLSFHSPGKT